MKLSPPQISMLRGLACGFTLRRGMYGRGGLMPPRFEGEARQEYSAVPLAGLVRRGLVKPLPRRLGEFGVRYVITDEGRAALETLPVSD